MTANAEAAPPKTGEVVQMPSRTFNGQASRIGLVLPEGLTYEQWRGVGDELRGVEGGVLWWLGDWLRYGEKRYGMQYSGVLEDANYAYQTLRDARWLAGKIELSRRRDNLPWSFHKEVGRLDPDQQDELLDCAVNQRLSRRELRAAVRELNPRKPKKEPPPFLDDPIQHFAAELRNNFLYWMKKCQPDEWDRLMLLCIDELRDIKREYPRLRLERKEASQ